MAAVLSVVPESRKASSRFQTGYRAATGVEDEFVHNTACRAGTALYGFVTHHIAGGVVAVAAHCEV